MDQRGYPVDPTGAAFTGGLPAGRLKAWAALAADSDAIDLVPAQDGRAA
ncbi:hypothetical protein ACPPVS_10095 [Cellulomonas sp. McL0617]